MRLDDGCDSVPVTVRRWLGTLAKPCFKLIPATNCFWIRYKWKSQKAEKEVISKMTRCWMVWETWHHWGDWS